MCNTQRLSRKNAPTSREGGDRRGGTGDVGDVRGQPVGELVEHPQHGLYVRALWESPMTNAP